MPTSFLAHTTTHAPNEQSPFPSFVIPIELARTARVAQRLRRVQLATRLAVRGNARWVLMSIAYIPRYAIIRSAQYFSP